MRAVDQILADPSFDVVQFVRNVNIHDKTNVMSILISDPRIRLSIAESEDWEVLRRYPGSGESFVKMADLGLEAWTKKTARGAGNVWYGIVAHDELALSFRRINGESEVEVYKGKNAAENARKRWKQLNMYKLGQENPKKHLEPGKRPIDLLRKAVYKAFDTDMSGWSVGYDSYRADDGTEALMSFIYDDKTMRLRVEASGPNYIRLAVYDPNDQDQSKYYSDKWESVRIPLHHNPKAKKKDRIPKSHNEVINDIMTWLSEKNSVMQDYCKNYCKNSQG